MRVRQYGVRTEFCMMSQNFVETIFYKSHNFTFYASVAVLKDIRARVNYTYSGSKYRHPSTHKSSDFNDFHQSQTNYFDTKI